MIPSLTRPPERRTTKTRRTRRPAKEVLRESSAASCLRGEGFSSFPPRRDLDLQPHLIDDPLDDEVDEVVDLRRFVVEAGGGRNDHPPRLGHRGEVPEVDE